MERSTRAATSGRIRRSPREGAETIIIDSMHIAGSGTGPRRRNVRRIVESAPKAGPKAKAPAVGGMALRAVDLDTFIAEAISIDDAGAPGLRDPEEATEDYQRNSRALRWARRRRAAAARSDPAEMIFFCRRDRTQRNFMAGLEFRGLCRTRRTPATGS